MIFFTEIGTNRQPFFLGQGLENNPKSGLSQKNCYGLSTFICTGKAKEKKIVSVTRFIVIFALL